MVENSSLGNSRQEIVEKFTRVPGLGRSRAEFIYDAGYTNLGLLRKASVDELTKIPGVGISLARCIKNNLPLVKDEQAGEISVVPAGDTSVATPGKIVVGDGPAGTGPGTPAAAEKKPTRSLSLGHRAIAGSHSTGSQPAVEHPHPEAHDSKRCPAWARAFGKMQSAVEQEGASRQRGWARHCADAR